MNRFIWLIRREIWEHKAIWVAPLIVLACLLITMVRTITIADMTEADLSIRALKSDEFRADWDAYQETAGDGSATLGDHFRNRS